MFRSMVFGAWLATQSTALAADDFGPVEIGQPAPAFSLPDLGGETVTLEQHRGKVVVLEWFNPGCPFVVYAHEKGPLMAMAKTWTDKDVVWLAINSGAPGKQGAGLEANTKAKERWAISHPILLDESGVVGRAYGAKTTPQMVVIDEAGRQVYNGGLDNAPFGKARDPAHSDYTSRVLAAVTAGKASPHARTKPYGCSVKYGRS